MASWTQIVVLSVALFTALVNFQTARLNAKLAKMRAAEEKAKVEKEKAAPAETGSDS